MDPEIVFGVWWLNRQAEKRSQHYRSTGLDVNAWWFKVDEAAERGSLEKALALSERALEKWPGDPDLTEQRAALLEATGQWERAFLEWELRADVHGLWGDVGDFFDRWEAAEPEDSTIANQREVVFEKQQEAEHPSVETMLALLKRDYPEVQIDELHALLAEELEPERDGSQEAITYWTQGPGRRLLMVAVVADKRMSFDGQGRLGRHRRLLFGKETFARHGGIRGWREAAARRGLEVAPKGGVLIPPDPDEFDALLDLVDQEILALASPSRSDRFRRWLAH